MAGSGRSLVWTVAVLSGAAAVGLGLMVWLVDLNTAGQAGSVAGAVVSLISLALSVYALLQQSGSSGSGVEAPGERSVAIDASANFNLLTIGNLIHNGASHNHFFRFFFSLMGIVILGMVGMGVLILFAARQPPTVAQQPPAVAQQPSAVAQQPSTDKGNEKPQNSDSMPVLPMPIVPCLQGCRDLQLGKGQNFDIETWSITDDISSDIAVGDDSLHDYKLWPLNGAGIQPILHIPAGALDAADCPADSGYSTGPIPLPPTIPFCLLTAEGTRVMLIGQEALNIPFRPFLTSTFRPR